MSWAPSLLHDLDTLPRHGAHERLQHLLSNIILGVVDCLDELVLALKLTKSAVHVPLHDISQALDRVHVGTTRRPLHHVERLDHKELFGVA